jgi:hypothetical protein
LSQQNKKRLEYLFNRTKNKRIKDKLENKLLLVYQKELRKRYILNSHLE